MEATDGRAEAKRDGGSLTASSSSWVSATVASESGDLLLPGGGLRPWRPSKDSTASSVESFASVGAFGWRAISRLVATCGTIPSTATRLHSDCNIIAQLASSQI